MRDVRPTASEPRTQQARDLARQPVVREEQVVRDAFSLGELRNPQGEPGHLVVERVFVKPPTGSQVDDSRQLGKLLDGRVVGRLAPGEDVGRDAAFAECGADLAHVNIESAVGAVAE